MSACPRPRRAAILAFARDPPFWGKLNALAERAPAAQVVDLDGMCALVLNTVVDSFAGVDVAVDDDVLRAYQALSFRLFHLDVFLPYERRDAAHRRVSARKALQSILGRPQDAPYPPDPAPLRAGLEALFLGDNPIFA